MRSDVVDAICFCTKNPAPMLERLPEIHDFQQIWYVTITPYGKDVEPHVPDKESVIDSVKKLSDMVGRRRVHWRYDPILLNETYSIDYHIRCFEKMSEALCDYVASVVISFVDLYAKTRKKYGITIRTCCENSEFAKFGVDVSGCMTQQVIEQSLGYTLKVPKRKPARQECNCLLGNDIGMYNPCDNLVKTRILL